MLSIEIPGTELWDYRKQEFVTIKSQVIQLEHSLVSISKWESKWNKPFLGGEKKTEDEMLDYIRCMTLTQNADPRIYMCLTADNIKSIRDYIDAPMTATKMYTGNAGTRNRETVTSEIIYYWMIAFNIPFECQKWHLNRLLTLIKVCSIKNAPQKKRSQREIMSRNAALNAARRKQLNTRG